MASLAAEAIKWTEEADGSDDEDDDEEDDEVLVHKEYRTTMAVRGRGSG